MVRRLDGLGAVLQLRFGHRVAGLAGPRDVQQRRADPVIRDLGRPLALVGHVAIGTGHARSGMHSLRVELELRVLRLQQLRARLGMDPVVEAVTFRLPGLGWKLIPVVVCLDLLDLEPVAPGKEERRLRPAIVLHVALGADVGAHLLARRVPVRIVARPAPTGEECRDPADESRPGDAELHRRGIVAIHAGDGVRALDLLLRRRAPVEVRVHRPGLHDLLMGRGVAHAAQRLEAPHHVASAQPPERRDHRRVAVQARPRLRPLGHPPGHFLVREHVGVPAPFPIVDGERVAGEGPLQPRTLLRLLAGHGFRAAVASEAGPGPLRRPLVRVVLPGPVDAPGGRIGGLLGDVHEAGRWS